MNKKKALEILGIIGAISGLIETLYEWKISNDEWDRTQSDWAIMDVGQKLSDQYWKAYFDFNDKKISSQDYVKILQDLKPQYEK